MTDASPTQLTDESAKPKMVGPSPLGPIGLTTLTRLTVLVLLLLAFALRVYALDHYPPGASPDESGDVIDILNIARSGRFPLYEDYAIPEPLHRMLYAALSLLVGNQVWSIRFLGACFGVLTVALTAWVARISLRRETKFEAKPSDTARAALEQSLGITIAVAVLTLSLSHIVISRAIYRAILQPLFTLFFVGWLLRGLAKAHWRSFFASGVALALTLFSYTAGLVVPVVMGLLGIQLLTTQPRAWRRWLPGLLLLGLIFLLCITPILYKLWTHPQFVIGRARELNGSQSTLIGWNEVQRLVNQFVVAGDSNPQYNIASAPLVSNLWLPFFVGGLLLWLLRFRRPAASLLLGLLILATIPVLLAGEIPHGLRIMGVFAVLPILIGAGYGQIMVLIFRVFPTSPTALRWQVALGFLLTFALIGVQAYQTTLTYFRYWETTGEQQTTLIYNRELPIAEWFFRPDRRELANWINAQHTPLLIPRDELSEQTTHAWLAPNYPSISASEEPITLPVGTTLVVPWSLELGDLRRTTRHYALLANHRIHLLPPFSAETHAAMLNDIDEAQPLTRTGALDLMARIRLLPPNLKITFEPTYPPNASAQPLARFQPGLNIRSLRGPLTISDTEAALTYTLEWLPIQQPAHLYSSFLQLQTQEGERLAGDDVFMGRWLLAAPYWRINQIMPDVHHLTLPPDLAPGAYKLVAGLYLSAGDWLPLVDAADNLQGNSVQLAWVKRPLPPPPSLPTYTAPISAVLADTFALQQVYASQIVSGSVELKLAWRSLRSRPDIDATIFVHLVDAAGNLLAQQDARPLGGQYPTFIWDQDEVVVTTHQLALANVDEPIQIFAGMYTFPDLARLDVVQNGALQADGRVDLGLLSVLLAH
ncbi:MAG: hypothetical protein U0175_08415 [Caldilineaceae bacterium]